jgi:hypothetical protein
MRPTQLRHPHLNSYATCRGLDRGRCDRSANPPRPSLRYRANQAWTVCLDVPSPAATSVTDAPAKTARTASKRRSTTDNATSANPGLRPTTPTETSPIKKAEHGHCQASPGTGHP